MAMVQLVTFECWQRGLAAAEKDDWVLLVLPQN